MYSPNGAGQISEPGNDRSITIYGEVGPLPGHEEDGANSSYCFGSTIPSFTFKVVSLYVTLNFEMVTY